MRIDEGTLSFHRPTFTILAVRLQVLTDSTARQTILAARFETSAQEHLRQASSILQTLITISQISTTMFSGGLMERALTVD